VLFSGQIEYKITYILLQATIEQRKLAVDLAEVIIKWEYQRVKEQQGQDVIIYGY